MKFVFTLIISLIITPLSAQIVNGNFESWVNFQGYLLLQGWEIYSYEDVASVTQDFDAYEGMYAVKVTAQDTGLGAYGRAGTAFPIDNIPPSLDFYVKASSEFGSVAVEVEFYNDDELVNSFAWTSAEESLSDWTFVSIPLDQNPGDISLGKISITAQVGDFASGSAVISVDQMAFGIATAVEDQSKGFFNLYPNPASKSVYFDATGEIKRIEIRDHMGKQVGTYTDLESQHKIPVHHLAEGYYTVMAYLESGATARQKLVVVH